MLLTHPFTSCQGNFKRTFDHPLRKVNAVKRLLNLKQRSQSVAEFIIEFRIVAAETGWQSNALQGVLLNAFNDQMKDQLASSFEDLITLEFRIDT